jgi:ribonuclease HI
MIYKYLKLEANSNEKEHLKKILSHIPYSSVRVVGTKVLFERVVIRDKIDNDILKELQSICTITEEMILQEDMDIYYTDGSSNLQTKESGHGFVKLEKCSANQDGIFDKFSRSKHSTIIDVSKSYTGKTNNEEELSALLDAAKNSSEYGVIFADSKYGLDSIREWYHGWVKNSFRNSSGQTVKNLSIIKELFNEVHKKKLSLGHVKGHEGDALNELVDQNITVREQ